MLSPSRGGVPLSLPPILHTQGRGRVGPSSQQARKHTLFWAKCPDSLSSHRTRFFWADPKPQARAESFFGQHEPAGTQTGAPGIPGCTPVSERGPSWPQQAGKGSVLPLQCDGGHRSVLCRSVSFSRKRGFIHSIIIHQAFFERLTEPSTVPGTRQGRHTPRNGSHVDSSKCYERNTAKEWVRWCKQGDLASQGAWDN